MNARQALAFVRTHGVVLTAAKGPVPRLSEAVAGEPIAGSWWAHPKGREIFRILQSVTRSPDVLVCRVVDGKITLVHRRLWAALVRSAEVFPKDRLAQVHEEHMAAGHHENVLVEFPAWVPEETTAQAATMGLPEALAALGPWAAAAGPSGRSKRPARRPSATRGGAG